VNEKLLSANEFGMISWHHTSLLYRLIFYHGAIFCRGQ